MSKKELILLVGPMGSGKSTYANEKLAEYHRISQDEMGKEGHLVKFAQALKTHDKIVIDRINHLRDQRERYLAPAREAGFSTKILVMNRPFKTCHTRLMKRDTHPTLTNKDEGVILNALSMYFNQYEYVQDHEADHVERLTDYDPFILDITPITSKRRAILIGDVHGCFDELMKLLAKVQYDAKQDVVIFAGDLVDRGPAIDKVLDFVRNSGGLVYTVMSNHENKLLRFLRGNKVNAYSLKETLAQVKSDLELRLWLEGLPYAIKFGDNQYIVHAGIDPTRTIFKQRRDTFLYARTFNPKTFNMTDPGSKPWFTFDNVGKEKIHFGHAIYDKLHVSNWAKSLDGGCVHGGVLRAHVIYANGYDEVHEVKTGFTYQGHTDEEAYHQNLAPFEALVQQKYLSKSEKGQLVLYKYTDSCTFERKWDQYTRQARGIIFNRKTGECIARPFSKFFNVGEMPETQLTNLPVGDFEVFDKLDGSLGIMYWENGLPHISTAGSFFSDQAIEATKMLHEKVSKNHNNYFDKLNRNWTLLFEIIYPANKIVCNYGNTKDLFLLAVIDRDSGIEMERSQVEELGKLLGFPVVKTFQYCMHEMLELQKTLPFDQEGFIVRYSNGLRLKIKGEEYLRIHRAISGATPLNVWDNLVKGKLPDAYKQGLPEEVLPTIEEIESRLNKEYVRVGNEIYAERVKFLSFVPDGDEMGPEMRKKVGLTLTFSAKDMKHRSAMFPLLLRDSEDLEKYIMKLIRPKGNYLEEK